ncbi:Modification methylase Eco57IB [Pleomorphomonas sp. T1.2MG-36]|uniref:N-6 DNA methylase n=1 Tax=Pleomorphomonas sp. T1.2MG-36 TaxID=3041167 RepID=UPI0024773060|nr:N-6 DNA methylase [Pleomorphomonas sp. T1.2MG-36]CAI9417445.1 Modification methylase Eco57IB [Pleomorphomonas sp. T1.2MG-36]
MGYESPIFDQKESGAFFTPIDVAQALVRWAVHNPSDRLLDPSCGSGHFLAAHRNSVGIEQNPLSAQTAMTVAPWSLVHEGDFFAWASETQERFECAAGNPPFIRYQSFSGILRNRALKLCAEHGVNFSGLSSSWAPFLVATASLLKQGGRMAFVVPAEIGHAPYAAPLLEYLVASFSTVHIVAIRSKLFPTLSEDCWLLYADGHGGVSDRIGISICDRFAPSKERPVPDFFVDVVEWRSVWGRRLRPYLISAEARRLYSEAAGSQQAKRLGDFAQVGIGYVSGDNEFFHLRPSEVSRLGISQEFLHPSLRNGRAMPSAKLTPETVENWTKQDQKIFLLRLQRGQQLPGNVRRYLDSSAGREASRGYKCRNRSPWYVVPDVQVPDYFLSYMSGRAANLVRNLAGVTCTNSVHSVRLHDRALAKRLLPLWSSPFVKLSCELEGHALGGGMLKLEPREAKRILFPSSEIANSLSSEILEEATRTLQRWRHYAG